MLTEYIDLGKDHILDIKGVDHILFIATLCSLYFIKDWRKILWLVTAFTLGHCITLALSSMRIVHISPSMVEILIPVTIIISAAYNIYIVEWSLSEKLSITKHYILTFMFGLIHGLGFSNSFKEMFSPDESIFMPLLGFNIGVELGQLIIVGILLLVGYLITLIGSRAKNWWTIGISWIVITWAVNILKELIYL
jgi:hypothetical protein